MTAFPRSARDAAPPPNGELTFSATTRWAAFDPTSLHLQDHLEETVDALLDRGVELVGFFGTPDPLADSRWERVVRRFLASGFRGLLHSPLTVPLTARQLDLLARLDEIRVPILGASPAFDAPQEENLRHLQERFAHSAAYPPKIVRVRQDAPFSPAPHPMDHTRGCLDPWEGFVASPSGETHPCAVDPGSLGDHRKIPWSQLLNSPEARRRRTELLCGTLAPPCRTCRRAPWVRLDEFRESVARHTQRILPPEPPPTSEEIRDLISAWIAEDRRVLIYPAGNHARWFLQTAPTLTQVLVGFGDRDPAKRASPLLGLPGYASEDLLTAGADLILVVAGDLETDIHRSLQPLTDRGIEVLAASRLHRHWLRLSALHDLSRS